MKLSILTAILTFTTILCAQTETELRILVKPVDSKLWGFSDQHGRMIIEDQFKTVWTFGHNGYAMVKDKKDIKVLDKLGKEVKTIPSNISPKFMRRLRSDIIPFEQNDMWGGININGQVVVKAKYEFVSSFSLDGFATARLENEFFVLHSSGSETKVQVPDIDAIKRYSEGLIAYKTNEGLFGFVNALGNEVIKPQFRAVGHFESGLCWVRDEYGLIGFIDKKGEYVIKPIYDKAKNFDKDAGIALVKTEESEWFLINMKGEELKIPEEIERPKEFEGGFMIAEVEGLYGAINNKGEWVVKPVYTKMGNFKNGFCPVKSGDLWGFIDVTGKEIIKPKFASVKRAVDLK